MRLFPTDLPSLKWVEFQAQGYSAPVTGAIYRSDTPADCGMPLGGLDTGCLDLETSGMLGNITLFNSYAPCRGPLNVPFLKGSAWTGKRTQCSAQSPWPGSRGRGKFTTGATTRSRTWSSTWTRP